MALHLLLLCVAVGALTLMVSKCVRKSEGRVHQGAILSPMWNKLHLLYLVFCLVAFQMLKLPCLKHDTSCGVTLNWSPDSAP